MTTSHPTQATLSSELEAESTQQQLPPTNFLCSFQQQSTILDLERDSHSRELQCYNDVLLGDSGDLSNDNHISNCSTADNPMSSAGSLTTPSKTSHANRRGTNWSAIDRYCFITALDNHNPWITATSEEASIAWTEAVAETNKALLQHKRETRNSGAFEAQWRKMVKDVREQKSLRLKATGANFDVDELYTTLYNLVDLYNSSAMKLAFLKPQDTSTSLLPLSQMERYQKQKRKQAVIAAREAGQTGQTLALQRLRDRQASSTSTDSTSSMLLDAQAETNEQELDIDLDQEESQSSCISHRSPTPKRRRTSKAKATESLVTGINKLIDLHTSAMSQDNGPAGSSQSSILEVSNIKSQVSQLQSDVADISSKMDAMMQMLMDQWGFESPR